jgi:spermidine synthase
MLLKIRQRKEQMSQPPGTLLHRDYWNGYLVEITDSGDFRSLYFASSSLQGKMSLSSPHKLVLSYTQHMLLTLLINPEPKNILIIGIGAGSFIRFFHHHFPHSRIDAVDYSQHIINTARGYFQLPENNRIAIHCEDGCQFLKDHKKGPYDLILVDAFNDQGMAPTIYSDQFFHLCVNNLTDNGVVSSNLWSGDSTQFREIRALLATHFTSQISLPVPGRGNIVTLALAGQVPWSSICLRDKELKKKSVQFDLNFKKIVNIAKKNNMTLSKRITSFMMAS